MSLSDLLRRVAPSGHVADASPATYIKAQGATGRIDPNAAPDVAAANDASSQRPHVLAHRDERRARRDVRGF